MNFKTTIVALATALLVSACGTNNVTKTAAGTPGADLGLPPVGVVGADGGLVKSRVIVDNTAGATQTSMLKQSLENIGAMLFGSAYAYSGAIPSDSVIISVTNAGETAFAIDHAIEQSGSPYASANDLVNFLPTYLTALDDNTLVVCGQNGDEKCSVAKIRVYLDSAYEVGAGVAQGAGLTHVSTGQVVPIMASSTQLAPAALGLGVANAQLLQSFQIPAGQQRITMADFNIGGPNAGQDSYSFSSDMTLAGVGLFKARLVFEYVLE